MSRRHRAKLVKALNAARIATLEIEMFRNAAQMPRDSRENLPHTFAALKFLAEHPAIDAARIGVMGFSRGGGLAIMSATQAYSHMYSEGKRCLRQVDRQTGAYPGRGTGRLRCGA